MNPQREWLVGCTVGAWIGLMFIYAPVVGAVLVVAFAIPAAIGRSLAAIAGLFIGSGGVVLMIIALMNWNCAGLYGGADEGCGPPDLTGRLIAGGVMLAIGLALTLASVTRSRRMAP